MTDPGMASVRNAIDAHLAAHTEHDQARDQVASDHYDQADAAAELPDAAELPYGPNRDTW